MRDRGDRTSILHAMVLAGVLTLAVGLPLALSIQTGSLWIPHNDAWSHSKIAQLYAADGSIELQGWNRTALIGQVVVLGRLGASIAAQQVFVAGLAMMGLVATYLFLRPRVGSARALLGTATIGVATDFGLLSTSFMSDIPAFAAMMVCLVAADVALRRNSLPLLLVGVAVGLWGATVREQAVAAPAAVLITAWMTMRGSARVVVTTMALMSATSLAWFELWRRSLPNGDPPDLEFSPTSAVFVGLGALLTLALYLAPAVLLVSRPAGWSAASRVVAVMLASGALVAVATMTAGNVFLGNYLSRNGSYALAGNGDRVVLASEVWATLIVLSCVSLGLNTGLLMNNRMNLDRMTLILGILLVGGTLAQAITGQAVSARYLLPLLPVALVPILRVPAQPLRLLSGVVLAGLFAVSVALTANALAYDAARWSAASSLVSAGVPATDIDAGMEWVGYHASSPVRLPTRWRGWTSLFPSSRRCYMVSANARAEPNLHLVDSPGYATFASVGTSRLWVYRVEPCLPPNRAQGMD